MNFETSELFVLFTQRDTVFSFEFPFRHRMLGMSLEGHGLIYCIWPHLHLHNACSIFMRPSDLCPSTWVCMCVASCYFSPKVRCCLAVQRPRVVRVADACNTLLLAFKICCPCQLFPRIKHQILWQMHSKSCLGSSYAPSSCT